jgi:hypothetical protein
MVILSSTPQLSQRYFRLTLRISPVGNGSGGSCVIEYNIAMPLFHRTNPKKIPNPTQMTVEKAGMFLRVSAAAAPLHSRPTLRPLQEVGTIGRHEVADMGTGSNRSGSQRGCCARPQTTPIG